MTAPDKPTIDEQILQNQLAEADRRAAGRPKPVAHMWQHGETGATGFIAHAPDEELRQWERMNKPRTIVKICYGPDILAYADRVAAERDAWESRAGEYMDERDRAERQLAAMEKVITAEDAEIVRDVQRLERQLAACQKECEEQARLNGMGSEREARLMAENMTLRADLDAEAGQLATLQAKHDALVKRLREPTPEMLKFLCDCDSDLMPGESLADAAMSAVALDKGGE